MNYKVGDEVICIDAMPVFSTDVPRGLVLGQKYIVKGFERSHCYDVVDVGIPRPADGPKIGICQVCEAMFDAGNLNGFAPWRFIKLEPPAIKARTEPALVEAK